MAIRSEDAIDQQMKGKCTDSACLEVIAERLRSKGFMRSATQVKNKLKKLKSKFLDVKTSNNTSGQKGTEFEFFDVCFEIWGHTASAEPLNIVSLSASTSTMSTANPGSASASGTSFSSSRSRDDDACSVSDDNSESDDAGIDAPAPTPMSVLHDTAEPEAADPNTSHGSRAGERARQTRQDRERPQSREWYPAPPRTPGSGSESANSNATTSTSSSGTEVIYSVLL